MKEIQLTQGQVAIVDNKYYNYLSQFKWIAQKKSNKKYYAVRISKQKNIYLHHEIIGKPPSGMMVDHKDHDGLNNQRKNLRFATYSENSAHSNRQVGVTLFRGVSYQTKTPDNGKKYEWYLARICKNGKRISLGCFKTAREGGIAYNKAAIKYFGKFAILNKL